MIIAFGHRRFVGKDTAADFLVSQLRTTTRRLNIIKTGFATKLKAIAFDLYSWAGLQEEAFYEKYTHLKEIKLPLMGKSPRDVWIELGNKCREINPDTWINQLLRRKVDILIIKDLRYNNEADAVKNHKGILVKIEKPGIEEFNDPADSALKYFTDWDHVIVNDGDLKELNNKIIKLSEILKR